MNIPKISIIVPCYNQAQFLNEALQSVLAQTYTNWECIIVNDGSPDNTAQIALDWTQKDDRFKYVCKENGGLSSARNAGIEKAKGEFILPLDADDKIGEVYIKLGIEAFNDNPELKVVYCKAEKFGEETGLWHLEPFSIFDLCLYNMIFCTALFKKKDWEMVGGYDCNMFYGLEDWEFWISILKNGGDVKIIPYIGFYYRITSNSMARKIKLKEREYSENYVIQKHAQFFKTNYAVINNFKKNTEKKIKSEKFILNLFTKRFLGFYLFKLK
jgi:glycosyltransferase involved in cell wall biosynthesis